MIRVPVFPGEFGLKLIYHVPAVRALAEPYECEIEQGEDALYPGAVRHIIAPRANDDLRAGNKWAGQPVGPNSPKVRFIPEPHVRVGIAADVVVCPRGRKYGAAKNWDGWQRLAERLVASGLRVFAAGAPDSSQRIDIPSVDHAWDWLRFLDASIEAMLSARVVVATDAGLAHLAVLCGRPLVLITHHGLTAPGPQLDVNGKAMRSAYPRIRWDRYNGANHTGSPIVECPTGWDRPEDVLTLTRRVVDADTAAA